MVFVMSGYNNAKLVGYPAWTRGLTGTDALSGTRSREFLYAFSVFENRLYVLTDTGMITADARTGEACTARSVSLSIQLQHQSTKRLNSLGE